MANPNIFNTTSIVAGNASWTLGNSNTLLMTVDADKIVRINSIRVAGRVNYATDLFLTITGMGSGAAGVTTSGADATGTICWNYSTGGSGGSSQVELITIPIYMMEGDSLYGYAGSNNYMDVIVSYEVIDDA